MQPPRKLTADESASAAGSIPPGEKNKLLGSILPNPQSSWFWLWFFGLLLIATFAAYQPIWHAGFIWDDDQYVTENATLRDPTGLWQTWFQVNADPQYYPLVFTTFWLEYHLWGLQSLGYHLDNVLLHALAAILLTCVLKSLQVPGAWLAGVIFAVHPVEVESVAWITERKNVLSTVFYFAAALAYLCYVRAGNGWLIPNDMNRSTKASEKASHSTRATAFFYGLALVLFIAALLSKTVTCSLPAALLLVCWWKTGRVGWADILPLLPFFAVGVALGLQTAWVEKHHVGAQGADWSLSFADRCLIAGRTLWFYAGKLAWPTHLTFIYPRWQINAANWWQWVFLVADGVVVAALWLLRNRIGRGALTGVLFFAGTLGPALGFVNVYPMRYSFVADHFQYLASVGIIALAGAGTAQLLARLRGWMRPAGYTLCLVLVLVLATLTWRQCGMYADLETLWRATIAKNPSCWMAYNNLGTLLLDQGKPIEAEGLYRRALELKPDHVEAQYSLGLALAKQGRWEEAIQNYNRALQMKPDYIAALNNLGVALATQGKQDEAIKLYQRALQIKSDDAEILNNLGSALDAQGKRDEAIQYYQRAIQSKSGSAAALNNLGEALAKQGKWDDAIALFEQALQTKPDSVETHYNLGVALATRGQWNEAIQQYERALQLKPDYAEALDKLGVALSKQMRLDEAISCFERVSQLKSDHADTHVYWGVALAAQSKLAEAIQHFERALQLKPDHAAAHYYLGIALASQGKSAEAIQHFQQAIALATAQGNNVLAESIRTRLQSYPPASP